MRNALFALVLVAASFAGGAVINGPALSWVKNYMTAPAPDSGLADKPLADTAVTFEQVPSAPLPLLAAAKLASEAPRRRSEPPRFDPVVTPTSAPMPLPALAESPSQAAPTDPRSASILPLALAPSPAAWADAPGSAPAAAIVGGQSSPREVPITNGGNSRMGDWSSLRKKLAAQGVARYRVEVDLDGKTSFSCVIPIVGRRSVGQHFEAEGDDEFQAAETVLKRIVLWKASEAENEPTSEPKP